MYSLTINFGPTGTAWAFLFKEKEAAQGAYRSVSESISNGLMVALQDDFGQTGTMGSVNGYVIEDLDQIEAARIYRSLAEERLKVKLMTAAKSDPVIGEAIRRSQGAPVLTPMGGGFRA